MRILIQAPIGGGKSTMAQLIKEALELYGIDATIEDEQLALGWVEDNEDRLDALGAKGLSVNIKTLNTPFALPPKFNIWQALKVLTGAEVDDLRRGHKIACIKKVRERTGHGLMAAKNLVEEFQL